MSVHIGPMGDLREVRCSAAPTQVSHDARAVTRKALDGVLYAQLPPSDRRTWQWSLRYIAAADLVWLVELEQGVHGLAIYFHEPLAAQLNMLAAKTAAPGIEPSHGWAATAGTLSTPGGGRLALNGEEATGPVVPVVAGGTYSAAAEADVSASVELAWVDAAGAAVGTTSGVPGTGLVTATGAVPGGAAAARVALRPEVPGAATFWQMRMTATGAPMPWHPGVGVPRIVLSGVSEAYRAVAFGGRRDHSVSITEVG